MLENQLSSLTQQRNNVAAQMSKDLEGAAFHNQTIAKKQAKSLEQQAAQLNEAISSLGH
jgi:hypothetical protein